MPLEVTPISQLFPTDEPCKMKVRIARLWGFEKPERPRVLTGLDMIHLDDKFDCLGDLPQEFLDIEGMVLVLKVKVKSSYHGFSNSVTKFQTSVSIDRKLRS